VTQMNDKKRAELYAALRKDLDTPANHALLAHLDAIATLEANLPPPRRIPLRLVPKEKPTFELAEGERGIFVATPYVSVRAKHLVLTESAAQYFDMEDFKIGENSQLLAAESIPLDFFSVTHNQKSLAKVSILRSQVCSGAMVLGVFVRRREDGQGPQAFQGLLWVECDS
jgi:hypothetical protein